MIIAGLYVGLAYYCILPPTGRYCTIVILVGYHLPSTLKKGLSGGRILGSDKNKHGNYRGSVLEVYNIVHLHYVMDSLLLQTSSLRRRNLFARIPNRTSYVCTRSVQPSVGPTIANGTDPYCATIKARYSHFVPSTFGSRPTLHRLHVVPAAGLYCPDGQSLQLTAAVPAAPTRLLFPGSHSLHANCLD